MQPPRLGPSRRDLPHCWSSGLTPYWSRVRLKVPSRHNTTKTLPCYCEARKSRTPTNAFLRLRLLPTAAMLCYIVVPVLLLCSEAAVVSLFTARISIAQLTTKHRHVYSARIHNGLCSISMCHKLWNHFLWHWGQAYEHTSSTCAPNFRVLAELEYEARTAVCAHTIDFRESPLSFPPAPLPWQHTKIGQEKSSGYPKNSS